MKLFYLAILLAATFAACSVKESSDDNHAEVSATVDKDKIKDNLNAAGDSIKKGAEKANEKLKEAGDAVKDKYDETKDKLSSDKHAKVEVEVKK